MPIVFPWNSRKGTYKKLLSFVWFIFSAGSRVSISFLSAHRQPIYHSNFFRMLSVWHQTGRSRTPRILLFEKSGEVPGLWVPPLLRAVPQWSPAMLPPLSVPPAWCPGASDTWARSPDLIHKSLLPVTKTEVKREAGGSVSSLLSGASSPRARMSCVPFLPSALLRSPLVRSSFQTKLILHHIPPGTVLYPVPFPAAGVT